jgi:glucose/arabinose dehydrogenase
MLRDDPDDDVPYGPEKAGIKARHMLTGMALKYNIASGLLILLFCSALYYIPDQLSVKLKLVADDLYGPVAMDAPKDGSGRIFICEQTGKIKVIKGGKTLADPFLDVSTKLDKPNKIYSEKGLLGIAFHPKYKNNGRFFIYFSAPSLNRSSDHKSILAEYKVSSANADIADMASEKIIMEIEEPEANHNGGQLAFGPDGYLYVGLGDGGGEGDKHGISGNSQDLNTQLGKILRIDINEPVQKIESASLFPAESSKMPYMIPSDNPFVNSRNAKPEIWAYGLRNPWRFSFDRKTGKLFCGDVGQNKWEEVDIIEKGKNYGWRIMEGNHCYNPSSHCAQDGLVFPIAEYSHETGVSITGGFVYRGNNLPELQGKYVFADWSGKMFYLEESNGKWSMQKLAVKPGKENDLGLNINSFGEDESGEMYILAQKFPGTLLPDGMVYLLTNK